MTYFTSGVQLQAAIDALPASKKGGFVAFDRGYYAANYMNAYQGTLSPLEHFVQIGADRDFKPSAQFDPAYYAGAYADLKDANLNAADLLYHFLQFGLDEGRAPNADLASFNSAGYLAAYPDVAAYVNANLGQFGGSASNGALAHYVKFGQFQGFTPVEAGMTFNLTAGTAAGADVMRLTGDQDVRIDFTNPANQITGLDLNGDGTIGNDGKENAVTGKAAGFAVVDAYARNPLNEGDIANNFLGDIRYDGTGFDGDGVNTDGNIFLGGLGADTALGGIGNDFLAGGGVAAGNAGSDRLDGGRNADFFFAELSLLSNTDGNSLTINGGSTSDDAAVGNNTPQDADWLLLQVSDDEDGTVVNLADGGDLDLLDENDQSVVTGSGRTINMTEIENVDASGNLYGFLNNVNVSLGGAGSVVSNDEGTNQNVGIGSSAQLNIIGSLANNILIGGFDNDLIEGRAGNDLLFGGNLNYNNNPNLGGIVNNGKDELIGGAGDDNIVFEADGGIIEGDAAADAPATGVDTLWLTRESLGSGTAATMTTDGVLRFDLATGGGSNVAGGLTASAGYGGADANANASSSAFAGTWTADQTNYTNGASRVQVQDMESVIATGLGAVDYRAAGTNDPELNFNNQQNHRAYSGDLDLRGTSGVNTLYASDGIDTIEGREGGSYSYNSKGVVVDNRDKLSGGNGIDTFIFGTQDGSSAVAQAAYGDNIDVIHRQKDANGDNIWDNYNATTGVGDFEQDFGLDNVSSQSASALRLTLNVSTADTVSNPLVANDVRSIDITVDGVAVNLTTAGMAAAPTMAALLVEVQSALTTLGNPDLSATLSNNTITIISASGKVLGGSGYVVAQNSGGSFANIVSFEPTIVSTAKDVLLFKAYEDRSNNEAVNDNAGDGSSISLGVDSYAQDRVVSFDADGTRIAEDQQYRIVFNNLTTQDVATIKVNGVQFQLTVGVDLDGNPIAGEDVSSGATQAAIQSAFIARLDTFINSFMDTNTAAGSVNSAVATTTAVGDTLVLSQNAYGAEQTVFMKAPEVTVGNQSGGASADWTVVNSAQHEVLLFNFDGRNGLLNNESVKFVGDTGVNRSLLATAKNAGETLIGLEATVVDAGVDNLVDSVTNTAVNGVPATTPATAPASVVNNTFTNANLQTNFAVHGDDLLIGGAGNDTIFGRTGDDRVIGSLGTDTVDGGKNWYSVQVLGEAKARVVEMNAWEAGAPAARVAALSGLTINNTTQILQTESGLALAGLVDGVNTFNDTLQFQQADFGANARFTITIGSADFTAATVGAGAAAVTTVALQKGGAGTVAIDANGDGVLDAGQVTTFSNFENIRTVSGTGLATAGNGQGFDTLNVAALSTALGGVRYELSNGVNAGQLRYDTTSAAVAATAPQAAGNFLGPGELIIAIDGVENVVAGSGRDYLVIDETEADKNNNFDGGLGLDVIDYQNNYGLAPAGERVAQPTVTIKVNAQTNVDTVTMTGGRVGLTVATDTLTDVEFINLNSATATSSRENDTLDVSNLTAGATVNYNDGTIKAGSTTELTVNGLYQVENVTGSAGRDTVVVANAAAHGLNTTSDQVGEAQDITFATFLDFDTLVNPGTNNARKAFAAQTAAERTDVINQGQFKFNLGAGTADTVDYSLTANDIAVRVELDATLPTQYVLVDSLLGGGFQTSVTAGDRIDVLTDVEAIVASQGESILDLTQSTTGLEIKYNSPNAADKVGNTATTNAYDVNSVRISDLSTASPLSRTYLELRDDPTVAAQGGTATNRATATWNRIEGSDNAERVILNSDHSLDATNTFNLRGGANEVKYNELTKSINFSLGVTDFDAANPLTTGIVTGTVTFQDGTGAGVVGPVLAGSGTHTITSNTANNGIAAGSLRIAASQDAEDNLALQGLDEKLFLISEIGTIDNQITVKLGSGAAQNSVVLTGFELISDAASNDVYDFGSLTNAVSGLDFIDAVGPDHDTIKVGNTAVGVDGTNALGGGVILAGATEISLGALRDLGGLAAAGFDFDVLDVTKVTDLTVTTVTGANTVGEVNTDEVVFGKINNVVSALLFESVVFTEATVAENGTTYVLNTTANTVTAGAKTITLTNLANTLSFGGTVLEQAAFSLRADSGLNAASGVSVTVVGNEAANITGGNGNDTIQGAGGTDTIRGGQGNDTLDGGFVAEVREVHSYTIDGAGAAAGQTITINGVTVTIGSATPGDPSATIVGASDADTIGSAFVRVWNATPGAFTVNNGSPVPDTVTAVTYDALTNTLSFTYAAGADPLDGLLPAVGGTAAAAISAVAVTAFVPRAESADTYVFEATAALNGVDTINNFNMAGLGTDDVLDFTAFLGAAGTYDSDADEDAASEVMTLSGGENIGLFYNSAALTAARVKESGSAGIVDGDVVIGNNAKAVVLVSADVDGNPDAANESYSVYYIQDTDAGAGFNAVVTLVGTINSATELDAGNFTGANFA